MAGIQFGGFAEGGSGGCGCCEDQCSCEITICVKDCLGFPLAGALVVPKKDGKTISTCVTRSGGADGNGCCKMAWETTCPRNPTATYELTVSKEGYYTYKKVRILTCDNSYNIVLKSKRFFAPVTFYVIGCCSRSLPGATVMFGDTEYTTDEGGVVAIGVTEPGTYAWTVSKDRFASQSGTITINPCIDEKKVFVYMEPASGYHCGFGLADPLPETLFLTDSVLGGTTIVWGLDPIVGLFGWSGQLPVHSPAQDGPGNVHCPETDGHVDYFAYSCSDAIRAAISVSYVSCRCRTCSDGFSFINFGVAVSERVFPQVPCPPTGLKYLMSPLCSRDQLGYFCTEDHVTVDPTIPLNYNALLCGSLAHGGTPNRLPWPVNFFTMTITE